MASRTSAEPSPPPSRFVGADDPGGPEGFDFLPHLRRAFPATPVRHFFTIPYYILFKTKTKGRILRCGPSFWEKREDL